MKILCFELDMPKVNTWNGQYTGAKNKRYIFCKLLDKYAQPILDGPKEHLYDFEDGWMARVAVSAVTAKQRREMEKVNCGFGRYDWMVSEIVEYGRILKRKERQEMEAKKKAEKARTVSTPNSTLQ